MCRRQVRNLILIVVLAHTLPAAAVVWLLMQPEVAKPRTAISPTPTPRKSPLLVAAPRNVAPQPVVAAQEPPYPGETVVLPTLDSPLPPGKSAVWCASFQMAWDRLSEDIVQEPIRLARADEPVDRLNQNPFPLQAIVPANVYTATGRYEKGIVRKVREDMARRFPDAKLPALEEAPEGVLAFAYLRSRVRFLVPFLNHPRGIEFRDSSDRSRRVTGFGFKAATRRSGEKTDIKAAMEGLDAAAKKKGISPERLAVMKERLAKGEISRKIQEQVRILQVGFPPREQGIAGTVVDLLAAGVPTGAAPWTLALHSQRLLMADDEREKLASFAIDPCHESSPDQLVLARMERKSTLAATLAELERSIASFPSDSEYRGFIPGDQVWIPEVSLDIDHRFRELEGPARQFLNKRMEGLYFRTALQQLRFRLDANGAVLDSVGRGGAAKLRPPINLTFDRPFLICVQKRGEKQPFLVMWIDNPGLMRLMRAPEAE